MNSHARVKRRAAVGTVMVALAVAARAEEKKMDEAWRPLFNGHDLTGWKMAGPGEFKIEDGHLVTHGGMGLLWHTGAPLGDCEIKVVYKTDRPNDNSGVFIRIDGPPKDPWFAVHHGYEVQIDDSGDDAHRTGSLYSLTSVKAKVAAEPGGYRTLLIRLEGDNTKVWLNETLLTDYTEGDPVPERTKPYEPERGKRPAAGYIGLQNHDDASRVRFKEVSVRPLENDSRPPYPSHRSHRSHESFTVKA